jgi:hypothetical protein
MQQTWLVCFCDVPRGWWRPFTRPGFQHVFALHYDARLRGWLLAEWGCDGLTLMVLTPEQVDAILVWMNMAGEVWSIDRRAAKHRPYPRLSYCVPFIARLLNLNTWAITPWQLRCALKRAGGTLITGSHERASADRQPERPDPRPGDGTPLHG